MIRKSAGTCADILSASGSRPFVSPHYYLFYVAIQIIGKYLLFLNRFVSNSYTISREYDDFRGSRNCQPITLMTGTE